MKYKDINFLTTLPDLFSHTVFQFENDNLLNIGINLKFKISRNEETLELMGNVFSVYDRIGFRNNSEDAYKKLKAVSLAGCYEIEFYNVIFNHGTQHWGYGYRASYVDNIKFNFEYFIFKINKIRSSQIPYQRFDILLNFDQNSKYLFGSTAYFYKDDELVFSNEIEDKIDYIDSGYGKKRAYYQMQLENYIIDFGQIWSDKLNKFENVFIKGKKQYGFISWRSNEEGAKIDFSEDKDITEKIFHSIQYSYGIPMLKSNELIFNKEGELLKMKAYGYIHGLNELMSSNNCPMIDVLTKSSQRDETFQTFFKRWIEKYNDLKLDNFYFFWKQSYIVNTFDQKIQIFWSILERFAENFFKKTKPKPECILDEEVFKILFEKIKNVVDIEVESDSDREIILNKIRNLNIKKTKMKDDEKIREYFKQGLLLDISDLEKSRLIRNRFSHGDIDFDLNDISNLDYNNCLYNIESEVARMMIVELGVKDIKYARSKIDDQDRHILYFFDVKEVPQKIDDRIFVNYK